MDEYICPACNRTHGPTSGYCDAVDPFRDHATQRELETRREIMAWVADKLERWEKLLEDAARLRLYVDRDDVATCKEIRMALSESNPKLKGA